MRGLERKSKVPLLFFLLLLIAIFPALLITYQNSRQLSKVYFASYTAQQLTQGADVNANQEASAGDLREKLLLIADASNGSGIKTVEQPDFTNTQLGEALLDVVEGQISELQRLKAIPQFEWKGQGEIVDLRKIKIFNQAEGKAWLELWDISVVYENVTVTVLMDVETSRFFGIYARSDTATLDLTEIPFNAYAKYLGLDSSHITFRANSEALGDKGNVYGNYQLLNDDVLVTFEVRGSNSYFQYFFRDAKRIFPDGEILR